MERRRFLPEQFFKYVAQPMSRDKVNLWVKVNNINAEKIELFFDFAHSLYYLIKNTYLGPDVINKEEDVKGHFDWCWTKTINNFSLEKIYFKAEGEHQVYFWNFFNESFYNPNNTDLNDRIEDFFNHLFLLHLSKTKSELDMLLEIYVILDKSLENSEVNYKKLDTP